MKKLIIVSIVFIASTLSAFELTVKNLSPEPLTFKWQKASVTRMPSRSAGQPINLNKADYNEVVINAESSQTLTMPNRPTNFFVEYPLKFETRVSVRGGSTLPAFGSQFQNTVQFMFAFPPLRADQEDLGKETLELNLIPFTNLMKYFSALEVKFDSEETTAIRGPELSNLHDLVIKK